MLILHADTEVNQKNSPALSVSTIAIVMCYLSLFYDSGPQKFDVETPIQKHMIKRLIRKRYSVTANLLVNSSYTSSIF